VWKYEIIENTTSQNVGRDQITRIAEIGNE
jgi:hypothetical protein